MKTPFYLNADNWEGCDVYLTNQDNRLWLAVCTDDNYGAGYVDARQLYEELKKYFEDDNMYQNEKGEYVVIKTYTNEDGEEVKQCKTYQANGWVRIEEYYPDGTVTETYEKE